MAEEAAATTPDEIIGTAMQSLINGDADEKEETIEAAPGPYAPEEGAEEKDGEGDDEEKKDEKPEEELTAEQLAERKKEIETKQAELDALKRKVDSRAIELEKRAKKFNAKLGDWKMERQQMLAQHKQVQADLNLLLNGDTRSVLSTISKLTGRDAVDVYREMGEALASDGAKRKEPEKDPELVAKLERLEQAEAARQAERKNNALIQQVYQGFNKELETSQDRYPTLAEYASQHGNANTAKELLKQMYAIKVNENRDLSIDDVCALAEHHLSLRKRSNPQPGPDTRAQEAKTGGGPETTAASEDGNLGTEMPGASISPSVSTASAGSARPATEAERMAAVARLVSANRKQLGL